MKTPSTSSLCCSLSLYQNNIMTSPEIKEALVVTSENFLGTRKRKLTPALERSSPSKCLVLTPYGMFSDRFRLTESPLFEPSACLLPSGTIDSRFEIPHPRPFSSSSIITAQTPPLRHIIFPFNLRHNDSFMEDSEPLSRLYPGTKAVSFDGYFLTLLFDTLPPKPWPVTIAGVQPYFTTDPQFYDSIPLTNYLRRSLLRISPETNIRYLSFDRIDEAFSLVFQFFAQSDISITEVQYWNNFFIIVLEKEDTIIDNAPSNIGHCHCFYQFEKDMERPNMEILPLSQIRERTKSLSTIGNVFDTSEYDELRPGVMLSSGNSTADRSGLFTTSGVLVEGSFGERFMTVASQGFPSEGRVFHPTHQGKELGQAMREIKHTDIALVKLTHDVTMVNETFESCDSTLPTRFNEFVPCDQRPKLGDTVYMDNPFLGSRQGTCGPHARTKITVGDLHEPKHVWVRTQWHYFGQGFAQHVTNGLAGSVIWDDNRNVLGFFRCAPQKGQYADWCLTVAADYMIEEGLRIVQ
ncbi:unnamed protein product [Penicillium salamii]|nr:unnamed protein product [Penicillium salamii]CAG8105007.1 unnamed protein product [Penicillium salamii]CAG8393938.1 unnamed protein product [Penicillium salamii]